MSLLRPADFVNTTKDYQQVKALIETYLQKVTTLGSFSALSAEEADELARLSRLAEAWEDSIPLMPIAVPTQTRAHDADSGR